MVSRHFLNVLFFASLALFLFTAAGAGVLGQVEPATAPAVGGVTPADPSGLIDIRAMLGSVAGVGVATTLLVKWLTTNFGGVGKPLANVRVGWLVGVVAVLLSALSFVAGWLQTTDLFGFIIAAIQSALISSGVYSLSGWAKPTVSVAAKRDDDGAGGGGGSGIGTPAILLVSLLGLGMTGCTFIPKSEAGATVQALDTGSSTFRREYIQWAGVIAGDANGDGVVSAGETVDLTKLPGLSMLPVEVRNAWLKARVETVKQYDALATESVERYR